MAAAHMEGVMDTPVAEGTVAELANCATGGVTVVISEVRKQFKGSRPVKRCSGSG
jgi:hypothetical protein